MTDTEREQEHNQPTESKETLRAALLNRVLDFVAPESKGVKKTSAAPSSRTARDTSYFASAVPKSRNPFNLSPSMQRVVGLILLALTAVDFVAFSRISTNRFFTLSGNLIYFFRLDTLTYHLNTLVEIQVIISLILSAVLGGLLIYWFSKFTLYLSDTAGLSVQRRHLIYILGALTIFFFVCFLVSLLCGNPYSSYETFHYLAPFLTYCSGLAIFGLSQLQFEV